MGEASVSMHEEGDAHRRAESWHHSRQVTRGVRLRNRDHPGPGQAALAPIGCDVLQFTPPQNKMRPKTERQLLALQLNVASGRLPSDTPINLPALTSATTVGDAIAEIETTLCDSGAAQSDLETAKDIAEALNIDGEDMELASLTSSLTARPGQTMPITLGLVNMSPFAETYSLTTSGPWPVSLSQQLVGGLGSGQVAVVTAYVHVPGSVSAGQTAQIQVTAQDLFSEVGLQREAVITVTVRGGSGGSGDETRLPVQTQLGRPDDEGPAQHQYNPSDDDDD